VHESRSWSAERAQVVVPGHAENQGDADLASLPCALDILEPLQGHGGSIAAVGKQVLSGAVATGRLLLSSGPSGRQAYLPADGQVERALNLQPGDGAGGVAGENVLEPQDLLAALPAQLLLQVQLLAPPPVYFPTDSL
jgi:hypothetical protein